MFMHKSFKKFITGLVAVMIMATMVAPIGASAATSTNGVLYWDFENNAFGQPTDDITYYAGNDDATKIIDAFNSRAWGREWPAKNADLSWKFTPSQVAHSTTGKMLADGGDYCLKINGNASGDWTFYSIGTGILLSDKEIIPGVNYEVEFDVLDANSWNTTVVAAYSKPSARNTEYSNHQSKVPWLKEGQGGFVKATMATEGKTGANAEWDTATAMVNIPESMYEDGYVVLYVGLYSPSSLNGHAVHFDNIKITPKFNTGKIAYVKANYGKVWDFETDYGRDGSGAYVKDAGIPGNAGGGQNDMYPTTFANGDWSLFTTTGDAWFRGPRIRSIADAKLFNNDLSGQADATDDGYNGSPAPGSNYCARMRPHNNPNGAWNKYTLGMRVKLTKDEFPAGNYTLNFYSGWTKPITDAFKMCVSVFAGEKLITDAGDSATVAASFADATQTFTLGRVGREWSKYTQKITLSDSDFDANGVATLMIYTSIAQLPPSVTLYIDDVSLLSDNGSPATSSIVNLSVTTVNNSVPEFTNFVWNKDTLEPLALPMN